MFLKLKYKIIEWFFSKFCGLTFDQVALLACFYEQTTGKDATTITEGEI